MDLTRENTAIVLDSTSDFVDAPRPVHANMRLVPLYVLSATRRCATTSTSRRTSFYERLAAAKDLPTTSQPTPRRLPRRATRSSGRVRADLVAPPDVEALRDVRVGTRAAEQLGGDRVTLVDTETASLAVALLAEAMTAGWSAGTTDEELAELVDALQARRTASSSPSATLEYLQKGGRIGKAQALAGTSSTSSRSSRSRTG